MGNKKKTHFMFNTYECTAVEKYLEDMAEDGWTLDKIKGYIFYFNKIEHTKVKYSVDLKPKLKTSEALEDYREYCKVAGWDYVCETNKLQIFCTKDGAEVVPINTDERGKFREVLRESIFELLGKFILALLFAFNIYIRLFTGDSFLAVSSNMVIFSVFIFLSTLIYNLIEGIGILSWSLKARRFVKEDKAMPYNSYDQLIKRNVINKLLIYGILTMAVIFVFTSNIALRPYIVLGTVIIVLLSVKKVVGDKNNKIILVASSSATVYYLFIFSIIFVLVAEGGNYSNKPSVEAKALKIAPITAEDFRYENVKHSDYFIQHSKSVLAESIDYVYFGIGDNYLSYKYLISNKAWVINFNKKQLFQYISEGKYGFEMMKIKDNLLTKLDDDIEVYSDKDNKRFIIASKDKILSISKNSYGNSDIDMFLQKVYEEVFIDNN